MAITAKTDKGKLWRENIRILKLTLWCGLWAGCVLIRCLNSTGSCSVVFIHHSLTDALPEISVPFLHAFSWVFSVMAPMWCQSESVNTSVIASCTSLSLQNTCSFHEFVCLLVHVPAKLIAKSAASRKLCISSAQVGEESFWMATLMLPNESLENKEL